MLCQNWTALGKTGTEIHAESSATSLNTLCEMAMISGHPEKRAGKWLRRWKEMSVVPTRLVTIVLNLSAHRLAQHPSDFFKVIRCPPKHCLPSQILA